MTTRSTRAITDLELPLPHVSRGKVREMFALGDDLLLVAVADPSDVEGVTSRATGCSTMKLNG